MEGGKGCFNIPKTQCYGNSQGPLGVFIPKIAGVVTKVPLLNPMDDEAT